MKRRQSSAVKKRETLNVSKSDLEPPAGGGGGEQPKPTFWIDRDRKAHLIFICVVSYDYCWAACTGKERNLKFQEQEELPHAVPSIPIS